MATKDDKSRGDKPTETEIRAPVAAAPASQPTQLSPLAPEAESTGAVGLDQIREILFGAVFRELERRLTRTDLHSGNRTKEIEQEARRRTDVLENHLQKDIDALSMRVEHALTEAFDALHTVERENRDAISALEKRIVKAEEAGTSAQRDLRNQLLAQAKSFLDEMQRLRTEVTATLQNDLLRPESALAEERRGDEERPRH
jgi:hypothetical protein